MNEESYVLVIRLYGGYVRSFEYDSLGERNDAVANLSGVVVEPHHHRLVIFERVRYLVMS